MRQFYVKGYYKVAHGPRGKKWYQGTFDTYDQAIKFAAKYGHYAELWHNGHYVGKYDKAHPDWSYPSQGLSYHYTDPYEEGGWGPDLQDYITYGHY